LCAFPNHLVKLLFLLFVETYFFIKIGDVSPVAASSLGYMSKIRQCLDQIHSQEFFIQIKTIYVGVLTKARQTQNWTIIIWLYSTISKYSLEPYQWKLYALQTMSFNAPSTLN
ncbi:hypothetical protein ACJX0J_015605, partial [Zea mays]